MQVQAHRMIEIRLWHAPLNYVFPVLCLLLHCPLVILCLISNQMFGHHGVYGQQQYVGNQEFTNGLAIVDSPAPDAVVHAGSVTSIAIDVSGDGQITKAPATGFDSLAIYLVSSQASAAVNLTVTADPGLLTQEPGSTVKHVDWTAPTCLSPGSYNLTFYEAFHFYNQSFFAITPIPLVVQNSNQPGASSCQSDNVLEAQPQPFSAPLQNVWRSLSDASSAANEPSPNPILSTSISPFTPMSTAANAVNDVTVTVGPSGVQWPLTVGPPFIPDTIVIEPAPSDMVTIASVAPPILTDTNEDQETITLMISAMPTPTPVTVVLVSVTTVVGITVLPGGSSSVYTSTSTSFTTTTAIMGMPGSSANYAGFLPINAISSATSLRTSTLCILSVLCIVSQLW